MADIVKFMQNQPNFYAMKGASGENIELAEQALGLQFAADYREYIAAFGAASFAGHELTGVCQPNRLNVVEVTLAQRAQNHDIPDNWYVVEEMHIDGIVIWQATSGEIYLTGHGFHSHKTNNSLKEYISNAPG